MLSHFLCAVLPAAVAAEEWAIVNIIRHGERTEDPNNPHLAPDGVQRSEYIARCASQSAPSLAFPLGPPTQLLASVRPHKSVRPFETLLPLAKKMDLHLGNNVYMADTERFIEYVHGLPAGATALISWQHWWITWLLISVYPDAPPYPNYCPYSEWQDLPNYTHGRCYDILFQLVLKRPSSEMNWHVTAMSMMNMGFNGHSDSPCSSAFEPHSNPTQWHQPPAPKGAIGLPDIHLSKCEHWCDPDVHLPGKSPSHCYASSCQKCLWCIGQPGNVEHPILMNELEDNFDGGRIQIAETTPRVDHVDRGEVPAVMSLLAAVGALTLLAAFLHVLSKSLRVLVLPFFQDVSASRDEDACYVAA
eukprot:TRINITY_DN4936_c0_g1_i1.p1 TRINITY_DN4936_c0_g1~~TRINITY_DN4936_c0_g1_i1.p1  ORF type:complete len:360 (-),score=37.33 TRINITY_DN4936_c0_g1_i1:58-1137(-)